MPLPLIIADTPLDATVSGPSKSHLEILLWSALMTPMASQVVGRSTYGHPVVDAELLNRLPSLKVVSNYGVGVDHIRLPGASERGIPVGKTPGILDGATADMGMTLLLAAARRLAEGDRYARSPPVHTL